MTEREKGGTPIPAGLFRASQLPAAPKPKPAQAEPSGPFKSTLVGVPASRPPPPLPEPVLAPPRWAGAGAYEGENAPEPRPSSIPQPPASPALAGEGGTESVRDSLERILDEALPADDAVEARAGAEAPLLGGAPVPDAPVAGDEPGGDGDAKPVGQGEEVFEIEAELADELDAYAEAVADPRPMPIRSSLLPIPIPRASVVNDRDLDQDVAAPARAVASPPRLVELSPSLRAEAEARGHAPPVAADRAKAAASAAPVVRAAPEEPSAAGSGLVFVGLMTLIAVGGWYITQGGFVPNRRVAPSDVSAPPALPRVPDAVRPGKAADVEAEAEPAAPAPGAKAPAAKASEPLQEQPSARRARRAQVAEPAPAAAPAEVEAVAEPAPEPTPVPAPAPAPVLTIAPVAEPAANLPERPSREEVQTALDAVRPALVECSQGRRGLAQADVTVASSGKVTKAVVGGEFAGSPESACMARALRAARFSPFREATFRVVYPYRL